MQAANEASAQRPSAALVNRVCQNEICQAAALNFYGFGGFALMVAIGEKHGDETTEQVLREIESSLKAHELIKIKVAGDDRGRRESLLAEICDTLSAAPVQHIGKVLVLYRENPELHRTPPKRPGMTGRSPGKLKR